MSGPMFKCEVQRRIGNLRLTVCVEQEGDADLNNRPLPPLRPNLREPSPLTWTDIGRRVNEIAHEFSNEMAGSAKLPADV